MVYIAFSCSNRIVIYSISAADMASAVKFLATRMEEMENSFLTIFCEAASKIAQSTESKLFIMMESSDGIRKVGGNCELKALYQLGRLLPQTSDLVLGDDEQTVCRPETVESFVGFKNKSRKRKKDESVEYVSEKRPRSAGLPENNLFMKEEEREEGPDRDYEDEENDGGMSWNGDNEDVADSTFSWVEEGNAHKLHCEEAPATGATKGW